MVAATALEAFGARHEPMILPPYFAAAHSMTLPSTPFSHQGGFTA